MILSTGTDVHLTHWKQSIFYAPPSVNWKFTQASTPKARIKVTIDENDHRNVMMRVQMSKQDENDENDVKDEKDEKDEKEEKYDTSYIVDNMEHPACLPNLTD